MIAALQSRPLPRKLRVVPIYEAIAEIRFENNAPGIAANLISSLVWSTHKTTFPKFEKLPVSMLPTELLQSDPKLRYVPQLRISGESTNVLIGDRILGVSVVRPYPGWSAFEPMITKIWAAASESKAISRIERLSMKYANLIEMPLGTDQFSQCKAEVHIDGIRIGSEPLTLKVERRIDGFTTIVQIMAQSTLSMNDVPVGSGLIIDIDVIMERNLDDFWNRGSEDLGRIHDLEKQLFFGLISEDALYRLGPEY